VCSMTDVDRRAQKWLVVMSHILPSPSPCIIGPVYLPSEGMAERFERELAGEAQADMHMGMHTNTSRSTGFHHVGEGFQVCVILVSS
jgi:hypothetical protein